MKNSSNHAHRAMGGERVGARVIPLGRPDMTRRDRDAVEWRMKCAPFGDAALVERWERMWSSSWGREAVLFDDPLDVAMALKQVFRWGDGARIAAGGGMHPAFREGFAAAWLRVVHHDLQPDQPHRFAGGGDFVAAWVEHFQGLPVSISGGPGMVVEDVTSTPLPLPGVGEKMIQVMVLDGNAMLQGGNAALLLCRDPALAVQFRALRHPPSGLVVALGMSQLSQWELFLGRRTQLAERYLRLRSGGWFTVPGRAVEKRWWHRFHLTFAEEGRRDGLRDFLGRGGIMTDSAWPFSFPEVANMACRKDYECRTLALPLYASLTDGEQKRIINRVHRWVERGGPRSLSA
ncbi:MAG: DegT/DnrJ/EryC1/StrS family aminotransferase [Magnetococcales bacterium]|nr:DegT/DnrJ/EryC1/StrS family aminotransferase [Magnetococcales bacterium]